MSFCDEKLVDTVRKDDVCCDKQDIINNNGMNVFINCGQVAGYDIFNEHFGFHENIGRIERKSVDHREYHIQNKILDICSM